ncbi:MAG: hypothetical protein KJ676_12560 [Alphaproteobacteria bacterium]|nr:hypothetical protein [Alphaproteobacteria bacterium]MBU1525320.1 hypothetical protein [Alphaproteobacteria bacterium]MBU2352275.1 hypothetical protein [Alphaproteobacteria bacterium]MBU2381633.1 hypothetical protein [Alphaproteobacteria bacterium]
MIGLVMDAVLMLLLVCAVGFGVRLERRLKVLRDGQLAFAGAVSELNEAAGRAEAALASLRAAGQETDLLHDRIVRARELKGELERLIARGGDAPARTSSPAPAPTPVTRTERPAPIPARTPEPAAPTDRMAALAQRIQALAGPAVAEGRGDVAAIVRAMSANPVSERIPNRTVRAQDDDLFAA